jgi:hypothetical protein
MTIKEAQEQLAGVVEAVTGQTPSIQINLHHTGDRFLETANSLYKDCGDQGVRCDHKDSFQWIDIGPNITVFM